MQPFKVRILGCGSALPTLKHFASSQVVEVRDKMFMIDDWFLRWACWGVLRRCIFMHRKLSAQY